jgi:hypothetical protein
MTQVCGCIRCFDDRTSKLSPSTIYEQFPGPHAPGWRYACEICCNNRCPHHSYHQLDCTNSNATGQKGSVFK